MLSVLAKAHVRGLVHPESEGFAELRAADCDAISGDSFERRGDAIVEIGNNVSTELVNMISVRTARQASRLGNPEIRSTRYKLFRSPATGDQTVRIADFTEADERQIFASYILI